MVEPKGMVFKNEHETNGEKWYSYTFSVSSKDKDGNWESASVPIRFWKKVEAPDNKTRIKITDGWQKPMKWKDGFVLGWFVKDYDVVLNEQSGFTALVDDDIPF